MNEPAIPPVQALPGGDAELRLVLHLSWEDIARLGQEAGRLATQLQRPVSLDEAVSHRLRGRPASTVHATHTTHASHAKPAQDRGQQLPAPAPAPAAPLTARSPVSRRGRRSRRSTVPPSPTRVRPRPRAHRPARPPRRSRATPGASWSAPPARRPPSTAPATTTNCEAPDGDRSRTTTGRSVRDLLGATDTQPRTGCRWCPVGSPGERAVGDRGDAASHRADAGGCDRPGRGRAAYTPQGAAGLPAGPLISEASGDRRAAVAGERVSGRCAGWTEEPRSDEGASSDEGSPRVEAP
ncbi:hypothetical protein SAZ11_06455 [Streptomyces sp. FXJ1.4098]|nr:hypothetical protein [Streptomyces sp. FXJ1.4098]